MAVISTLGVCVMKCNKHINRWSVDAHEPRLRAGDRPVGSAATSSSERPPAPTPLSLSLPLHKLIMHTPLMPTLPLPTTGAGECPNYSQQFMKPMH